MRVITGGTFIGLWTLLFAQTAPAASDTYALWERGGMIALLLIAVVVLWRQGLAERKRIEEERRVAQDLLKTVLEHTPRLEAVAKSMEKGGETMQEVVRALENLHCPLLDPNSPISRRIPS